MSKLPLNIRFMNVARNVFSRKTFSYFLGTDDYTLLTKNTDDANVSFKLNIPNIFYQNDSLSDSRVSIGPVLAIFDELSSLSLIAQDKNRRGGVSVYLSGKLEESCRITDSVIVTINCKKIGKSLGFCELTMHDSNSVNDVSCNSESEAPVGIIKGKLLASGFHIKYLPLGTMWDMLINSRTLPFVVPLCEYYIKVTSKNSGLWLNQNTPTNMQNDEDSERWNNPKYKFVQDIVQTNEIGGFYKVLDKSITTTPSGSVFHVHNEFHNILGILHGGVCAITAEYTAQLAQMLKESETEGVVERNNGKRVTHMNIKYLNPMSVSEF